MTEPESPFKGLAVPTYMTEMLGISFGFRTEPLTAAEQDELDRKVQTIRVARAVLHSALIEVPLDPIVRAVLDLHCEVEQDWRGIGECAGCDFGGWEAEAPEWPCPTVRLIASMSGIEVPE